jgi:hypothetical protein
MFLSGLCRPVLAGSRHSINNFHKVSVKAYVYHFAESIIPDAGIMFQTARSAPGISLVDFAPADHFHTLEIFAKIPVSVCDVVHFVFSFTRGILPSF